MTDILLKALKKTAAGQGALMSSEEVDAFGAFSAWKAKASLARKEAIESKVAQKFSSRDLEIHSHMHRLWEALSDKNTSDSIPEIHDGLVYADTSVVFKIAEEEAKDIFDRIELAIHEQSIRDV